LLRAGVAKDLIFTDKASGAKQQRPGLDACLDQLHCGDSRFAPAARAECGSAAADIAKVPLSTISE